MQTSNRKNGHVTRLKNAVVHELIPWFIKHQRKLPWRTNRTAYRVWISELMLQQTRVDQVIPYYARFMKRFPSLKSLAQAHQDDVLKLWEGLGYYSRARNLHKAAIVIRTEHGGRFPQDPAVVNTLPGIGPYTTAAICSLAFNQNLAVVDGNVIRVLTRLLAYPKETQSSTAKKELQNVADQLLPHGQAARSNEAFMELGAMVCTPKNPTCDQCPFSACCLAFKEGEVTRYPIKAPKKKIPHIIVGAAVVTNEQGEILIAQRPDNAMLGGLWEFPGGKQEVGETIQECIVRELEEELGITTKTERFLVSVKHAYSHFTMEMHTYFASIIKGAPQTLQCKNVEWVKKECLSKYAFSKADLMVISALTK